MTDLEVYECERCGSDDFRFTNRMDNHIFKCVCNKCDYQWVAKSPPLPDDLSESIRQQVEDGLLVYTPKRKLRMTKKAERQAQEWIASLDSAEIARIAEKVFGKAHSAQ